MIRGVSALLLLLIVCWFSACRDRSDLLQLIQGPGTLKDEWVEIKPSAPLKKEREISEVELTFPENYLVDLKARGVRLPDGKLATINVELIDDRGASYPFTYSAWGTNTLSFSYHRNGQSEFLPGDRVFPKVRLRSSEALEYKQIVWLSYNIRDHW